MAMKQKTVQIATKALGTAGSFELMISTEAPDRDQDIVLAVGAQLDNYMKNPVVMYAHDYDDLPVARCTAIEAIPGAGLKATMQFPPTGLNPDADKVAGLWGAGFLNAASIGFVPLQFIARTGPNGEQPSDWWPEYGCIFTQWELLEFSIVPVPANADALRLSKRYNQKRGRVLSGANETALQNAIDLIQGVLDQLGSDPAPADAPVADDAGKQMSELAASLADIRNLLGGK